MANVKFQGYVERGGQSVVTGAFKSTTPVQASYPGATVTVYLTGTTALASIFSDAGGTAKANPFTADTTGFWFFFATSQGYDVKFSGTGISAPWTLSNLDSGSTAVTIPFISVKDYGAVGDGVTDDTTHFVNANAAGQTLVIPSGTYLIGSNLTLSSSLWFTDGVLKPANGVTIQIDGPITAALYKCFDTSLGGTIQFGSAPNQWPYTFTESIHPEWWGVNGNVGPYDTAAVQAAINAAGGIRVVFSRHYYVTTINLTSSEQNIDFRDFSLIGVSAGAGTATITSATNASPIAITTAASHGYSTGDFVFIEAVLGNTAANGMFRITSTGLTTFTLDGTGGNGAYVSGGTVVKQVDCILSIRCTWSHLHNVRVGGNFNPYYTCGVHLYADGIYTPEFNEINGLFVENVLVGLAVGAHVNYISNTANYSPSTPTNSSVSETVIRGVRIDRGVERCIVLNQPNGKLQFDQPTLEAGASMSGWAAGRYVAARSFVILNAPADGVYGGSEFGMTGGTLVANNSNAQIGIRGANMHIGRTIWEVIGNFGVIEGDNINIEDQMDAGAPQLSAGFTLASVIPFGSGAAVRGQFKSLHCMWNRSDNSGIFVDAGATTFVSNFTVILTDTKLQGWKWDCGGTTPNTFNPIVRGCHVIMKGLRWLSADGTTTDITIENYPQTPYFNNADPVGNAMAVVSATTPKNGWAYVGAAGDGFGAGGSGPSGFAGSIKIVAGAANTNFIQTPAVIPGAFQVQTSAVICINMWLKATGTNGNTYVDINWLKYDGTGSVTASTRILQMNMASVDLSTFRKIIQYVVVPTDAQFAVIRVTADSSSGTTNAFVTGIRF